MDVVVVARPGVAEYIEERGSGALAERLRELAGRAIPPPEGHTPA